MPRVALVTGASRYVGGFLVARLARDPRVERVIAVDVKSPSKDMIRRMGRAEFVRADIRNPLIGKVLASNDVDTVVHAATVSRAPKSGSRAAMKDINVLGAMQLFAVCQRAESVRKVVLRSSSAVYGCGPKDPAEFTEEMSARTPRRDGYSRDMIEVEGFLRGLARRRPDIATSILRLAPMVGPRLNGYMSRYFSSPVVPTILGRDARLQLLHEEDAIAALERATLDGPAGTFNVAGDGIVMMSQSIRRAGRVELPMPFPIYRTIGRTLMGPILRDLGPEQLNFLRFGCVLDTTRMRTELGFEPRWTTMQAFDDFVQGAALRPVIAPQWIDKAETTLLGLVGAGAGAHR
ncbi:NAD-dependent epimerase/dehydratase family protein [Skermania sp. ID1734]|uniref:NAD-dependent epimerase/dehydratase family protein n=1 Tax=Skermania sp. ID1734 TaxID=2597516 RepID=UPI00117DA9EA|nr:NAD-dependent epimerase/dehydratase family protein [Skermania sp. ID1734]TSD99597.1 NAD-dependent epimerase/dehydratase family protein [Skermania sp. ID1734]